MPPFRCRIASCRSLVARFPVSPLPATSMTMYSFVRTHRSRHATTTTTLEPGEVLALDAEFVSLGAEETEITEDGRRVIVNPAHFSLARVSVCRLNGDCFIDDYVVAHEPIADYLTRYSGIVPGDLDPQVSRKHLATLKHVCCKLRWLVERRCRFLGHGLEKDFRIINIAPHASNVIDTVELFRLERQRKLSLRFLASVLLGANIQSEVHDSIEDARTAIELWRVFRALNTDDGAAFSRLLTKLYQIGRSIEWRVENLDSSVAELLFDEMQLISKAKINNKL